MQIRLFSAFLLVFACGILSAQPQQGLHFMRHTLQASYTNPAFLPDEGLVVSLPNVYAHLETTGPSFGDLITTSGGSTFFNIDNALSALDEKNLLRNHTTVETIGVSFGLGPVRLGIGHATHFSALVNYSDKLARLIWEGNSQFIDQTIDLGTDVAVTGYHEVALAASFKFKKITIGGRAKYLSGIGDISTDKTDATLYTNPDIYQLTLNSDFNLNTSGYLDYTNINQFSTDINFGDFTGKNLFSKNNGFAFDLGVSAELGKLKLAASLVDVGQINWTEDIENHRSKGSFVYDGLDFTNAIIGDQSSFGNTLDTLEEIFNVTTTADEYSTTLPQKIYLSAAYQWNDVWLIGASFYNESYRDESSTGISVGAQAGIWKWLTLGANYSIYNDNYANIGLTASAKLGTVQLLLASDNVTGLIDLDNTQYSNLRAGLNLLF